MVIKAISTQKAFYMILTNAQSEVLLLNSKLDSLSIVQQEETTKQMEVILQLRATNKGSSSCASFDDD